MARKIIVCSNTNHARYWCRDIFRESKIITQPEQVRALSKDINDYIFIEGAKYDYPPLTRRYYEIVREIKERCKNG